MSTNCVVVNDIRLIESATREGTMRLGKFKQLLRSCGINEPRSRVFKNPNTGKHATLPDHGNREINKMYRRKTLRSLGIM